MMSHRRKGMSMVEVVIALVIIAVISASTISIIMMSISADAKSIMATSLSESTENVIDCFRFAQTSEQFEAALSKTVSCRRDPENLNRFLLDYNSFQVTIEVIDNQFEYTAVNADSEVIHSFIYTKNSNATQPTQAQEGGGEN